MVKVDIEDVKFPITAMTMGVPKGSDFEVVCRSAITLSMHYRCDVSFLFNDVNHMVKFDAQILAILGPKKTREEIG